MPFKLDDRYVQPFSTYCKLHGVKPFTVGDSDTLEMVNMRLEVRARMRFLYTRLYIVLYRGGRV